MHIHQRHALSHVTKSGPSQSTEPRSGGNSPTVPLPPIGIIPKRLNGTEKVTTLGVISRITITSAGLAGISLFDILLLLLLSSFSAFEDDVENGL